MTSPLQDVGIVGIGVTKMARTINQPTVSTCLEAARLAVADAGLSLGDIDGLCARWPGPGGTVFHSGSQDWLKLFGHGVRWVGDTYPQGIPAVLDAAAAIITGQCSTVLVVGGQSGVLGGPNVASYTRPANEFTECWGAFTAVHFALVAQRYLHHFGTDRVAMAAIAAGIRNAGSVNPHAVMFGRGPFTAHDVLVSPLVASPFRLLDLCLASEGAAAIVLTGMDRARDLPQKPVRILGGGCEWHRQQYVDPPIYDDVIDVGKRAVRAAFEQADMTASDIDVFEVYDINTFEVVRQIELTGLCKRGEGVDYLNEAGIGPADHCPLNTDGGLLSYAHIGWGGPQLKVIEAVRQLRGSAGIGQVSGAQAALVMGSGSGAQYHNSMILGT
jgi:acetyl-CoA acetyltransferase